MNSFCGLAWESPRRFLACGGEMDNRGKPGVALFGAPLDVTTTYRPGARFGPSRIREVSQALEEYSPSFGIDIPSAHVCDLGDICLPFGNVSGSLDMIRSCVAGVIDAGRVPLMLGGEHLVTLPAIEAAAPRHPGLAVIHIDAHADMREEYLGEKLSHATVMRRVAEIVGRTNLYQVGIRSGAAGEMAPGRQENVFPGEVEGPLGLLQDRLRGRPVYVTLDIDVLDPAFAPGTGAPEPGGISSVELFRATALLSGFRVIGADVVEVAPPYDLADITSLAAAKATREIMLAVEAGFRAG